MATATRRWHASKGPVGLNIEAVTAPEIALSIIAEIVAVRRGAPVPQKARGMKFGPVPLDEARGAIMAHSQRIGERMIRKGSVLDEAALAALARGRPRRGDRAPAWNPATCRKTSPPIAWPTPLVSPLLARSRAATGRVNLAAEVPGLLRVDTAKINRLNTIDESLTIGTLPDYAVVAPKDLVATVKIIPFAVPGTVLAVAEALARQGGSPLTLHPFRPLKVGLVVTELPGLKDSATEKTIAATEQRVTQLTGSLLPPLHTPHEEAPIGKALESLISPRGRPAAGRRRLGRGGPARRRPSRHRARPAARSCISACRSIRAT